MSSSVAARPSPSTYPSSRGVTRSTVSKPSAATTAIAIVNGTYPGDRARELLDELRKPSVLVSVASHGRRARPTRDRRHPGDPELGRPGAVLGATAGPRVT